MSDFSFEHTVDVRFNDYDVLRHVNNAAYVTYLEEARVAYARDGIDFPREDVSYVLAHVEVDYATPIEDCQEVTVGVAITDVGRTSFTFAYEVRTDDGVAATAETVQVWQDPETGESRPIPDAFRAAAEEFEGGLGEA